MEHVRTENRETVIYLFAIAWHRIRFFVLFQVNSFYIL